MHHTGRETKTPLRQGAFTCFPNATLIMPGNLSGALNRSIIHTLKLQSVERKKKKDTTPI